MVRIALLPTALISPVAALILTSQRRRIHG